MAVTVYTLPACVQCDSTKRMMQRNQIEYDEVDMSQDPVALDMVKTLGYTAVTGSRLRRGPLEWFPHGPYSVT